MTRPLHNNPESNTLGPFIVKKKKYSQLISPLSQRIQTLFFFTPPYSVSTLCALLRCLPLIPVSKACSHIMFLPLCWNIWSPSSASTQETLHNLLQNREHHLSSAGPLSTTTQSQIYSPICCTAPIQNYSYMMFGMNVLMCWWKVCVILLFNEGNTAC